jgi:RHS repeat-associated protein
LHLLRELPNPPPSGRWRGPPISEYHYTLYYYDQAGNLVKTIPPEGVDISKFGWTTAWSDSVKTAKASNTLRTPAHWLPTQYAYNSLNQVVQQKSPDGGRTAFWYDRLGRLAISQNARQRGVIASITSDSLKLYSYTRYDTLGRITEVGQIKNTTSAFINDGISRSQGTLNSWFSARSNRRGQITNTVYDIGNSLLNAELTPANLRNRVAYTIYTDTATISSYNQGTYYSYDIHGNVDTLLQDYGNSSIVALQNVMNRNANNRWKKIVYGYDLISGKVNWVAYNPKKIDEFFHRYFYDAENRLTTVETSADSLVWERDARYEYYKHGPMASSVIGQQLVQGMDYAYTLQGWLKGVNSANLHNGLYDMGEDGKSNGQNKYIARDAFGYHLNYFSGDYSNINSAYTPFPDHVYKPNGTARLTSAEYRPLYNGNISSMMVNIAALNEPVLHNYKYDQLNRLTGMNTYSGFRFQTNDWGTATDTLPLLRRDATTGDGAYKERIAYDANGNILKYQRKGRYGDTPMDSLTYNYTYNAQGQLQNNKLNFVRDRVNNANTYAQASRDDLEDQATGNYTYDEIGNLIKDTKESITNIKWSVYGKILEITRTATAENTTTNTSANNVTSIRYTYDAAGNRISKRVRRSTNQTSFTWYVRDAQGNVMATYQVDSTMVSTTAVPSTNLQNYDVHLYGSSRLGTLYRGIGATTNYTPPENLFFERGNKQYELTNHLGNVLATISDKKKGYDTTGDGQVDYFLADTRQATDYHPFGWGMIGRSGTYNLFGYKYGFNGKENDKETTTQDYGMRIYDPRLGRFLSEDPITAEYPALTPYQFVSNTPIWAIDLDGLEGLVPTGTSQPFSTNSRPVGMVTTVQEAAKVDPKVRSLFTDFTPFFGTIKGGVDAYNGYDYGTGDKLAGWQRTLNVIPFVSGMRKITKVGNAAEKISDASKVANDVVKSKKAIVGTEKSVLNARNVSKSENTTSVIGKVGEYEDFASAIGAKSFQIPPPIWAKMTDAQRWAANVKFLDRAIASGGEILLSSPVKSIEKAKGILKKELEYFRKRGYELSKDGSKVEKK